nr:RecName: Full=Glucose-1-phosphate adenylyltransferase large subunit; AltName: Full=ADP-glucose pyrophosphorylase; AltName: Full=ADP-glucose synthase; AltName: Full=AGPase S; AltName: Full=Alpha-D-glucose-1-phosphate adenyl transferase [Spinacia oleracea]
SVTADNASETKVREIGQEKSS